MHKFWNFAVNNVAGACITPGRLRIAIYRAAGIRTETPKIFPRCFFGGSNISIGKDTFINYGSFFDPSENISIGSNASIGMNCLLITGSHKIGPSNHRAGVSQKAPIIIEDGCWIGANVTILPGVTIHKGAVIAAGAVVTSDCDADSLYGGVPAKLIRHLES